MSRPTYETSAHVAKELSIAAHFCKVFDCTYEQYPPRHPVNGKFVIGGETIAVAEIKSRNNRSTKYPTLMLSANKWERGSQWAQAEHVPFLLIVEFTDGLFMAKMLNNYEVFVGGRHDRGDPKDIERCVYVPIDSFMRIA
jgi:hypothetical protein